MAVALPIPYIYHPTEFMAVELDGQTRYWPVPVDTRTGNMVTEERANQLLRDLLKAHPEAEVDLLTELPPELGIEDAGKRKEVSLQRIAEQKLGNQLSVKLVTPGFAAYPGFRTTQRFTKVLVANKELTPLVGGNPVVADDIQSIDNGTFLLELFRSLSPADWQVIKTLGLAQGVFCDCTETDEGGNPVVDTFTITELYQLATDGTTPTPDPTNPNPTPVVTADPVVRVDVISCEQVTGWAANRSAPAKTQTVDIFINGQFEVTITPTKVRPDVAKYLRDSGYQASDSSLFGFEYLLPAKYRMGNTVTVQVFASGTKIEAGYNVPQTTGVCGIKPGGGTPPPAYVTGITIDGPPSLTANQTKGYWVTEYLSDDTVRRRTDSVTYTIQGGNVAGLSLTPTVSGAEVNLTYTGGDSTRKIVLVATLPNGGTRPMTIELVGNVCQRPANLAYKPQLVFNAVPASGGNARLFTSLDDANTTIGKHFDNTAPLNLSGSMFPAEMANYNVGTDVYYRWGPQATNCEHVSDGIYAVLSGDGTNGQKRSIIVVNGKIADGKPSDYVTPTSGSSTQEGIWGGTGQATTYYIKSIQTRRQPNGDYLGNRKGIYVRVKSVGMGPNMSYRRDGFTGQPAGGAMPLYYDDNGNPGVDADGYNYAVVFEDLPSVGAEYITVGPLDNSNRYINIRIADKSVTDTAFTTHYTHD